MGLNAVVGADFSAFTEAIGKAEIKMNDMGRAGKNVSRDLTTMVYALDGTKVMREAELAIEAITRVGGASRLTATEATRMSAPINEAIAKYRALGQEVPPHLTATSAALDGVTKANTSMLGSVTSMAAGYVTGMVTLQTAQRVIQELTGFVLESIDAAGEAEQIQARLASALTNTRQPVAAVSAAYNEYAQYIQAVTALEDDEVVSVMALATEMGVTAGQMGRVVQVSANLSAAWKIGLEEAMSIVVKGGEGMTKAFKAHAIELDNSRAAAEGLAYVLPELEARFGSNAADQLQTYAGRVTALSVAWGNLKEAIGGLATSGGVVTESVGGMTLAVRGLSSVIEKEGVAGILKLTGYGPALFTQLVAIGGQATATAANLKVTGNESLVAGDGLALMAKRVSDLLNPALAKLTPVQRGYVDQLVAANVQQGEIATALGVSEAAIRSYTEGLKEGAKTSKEWQAAEQKRINLIDSMHDQSGALARKWLADELDTNRKIADARNASVVSQFEMLAKYRQEEELALLGGTERQLAELEIRRQAALSANVLIDESNRTVWESLNALIESSFERQRAAIAGGADHFVAQIQRETEAVTQAAMTWSQAMSKVAAGEGTLGGTIQNGPKTAATRQATQAAWEAGNYYGPVVNGSQSNPRGTGPDWVKLGYASEARALGGPVSAGTPYLVGERGPELFVPGVSGGIVPNGVGGTSITLAAGAVQLVYPIMNDPRAVDQIGALLGDALLSKLRDAGWRPPARA